MRYLGILLVGLRKRRKRFGHIASLLTEMPSKTSAHRAEHFHTGPRYSVKEQKWCLKSHSVLLSSQFINLLRKKKTFKIFFNFLSRF
jgi:hypothetical protein